MSEQARLDAIERATAEKSWSLVTALTEDRYDSRISYDAICQDAKDSEGKAILGKQLEARKR